MSIHLKKSTRLLELSVFRNSIIADNLVTGVPDNCSLNSAAVTSLGFNVTDTSAADCTLDDATDQILTAPLLGLLSDNGGPTLSHLPLVGSPAIDMGDPISCPATDQRGFSRPRDGDANGSVICDAGAIEVPEPSHVLMLAAGLLLLGGLAERRKSRRRAQSCLLRSPLAPFSARSTPPSLRSFGRSGG